MSTSKQENCPFVCTVCHKCPKICNKTELYSHYAKVHFNKLLLDKFGNHKTCPVCDLVFQKEDSIPVHLGQRHSMVELFLPVKAWINSTGNKKKRRSRIKQKQQISNKISSVKTYSNRPSTAISVKEEGAYIDSHFKSFNHGSERSASPRRTNENFYGIKLEKEAEVTDDVMIIDPIPKVPISPETVLPNPVVPTMKMFQTGIKSEQCSPFQQEQSKSQNIVGLLSSDINYFQVCEILVPDEVCEMKKNISQSTYSPFPLVSYTNQDQFSSCSTRSDEVSMKSEKAIFQDDHISSNIGSIMFVPSNFSHVARDSGGIKISNVRSLVQAENQDTRMYKKREICDAVGNLRSTSSDKVSSSDASENEYMLSENETLREGLFIEDNQQHEELENNQLYRKENDMFEVCKKSIAETSLEIDEAFCDIQELYNYVFGVDNSSKSSNDVP